MRFRVQNVRKGYCEIWWNECDGQRYERMAVIHRHKGGWHWNSVDYHVRDGHMAHGPRIS